MQRTIEGFKNAQTSYNVTMENKELNLENTLTESMIEAQSTPMTTRVKELSMDDMFNLIRTMSENISSNLNAVSYTHLDVYKRQV